MDMICKSPLWKEYETRRKELLSSISDSTDTNNLENELKIKKISEC